MVGNTGITYQSTPEQQLTEQVTPINPPTVELSDELEIYIDEYTQAFINASDNLDTTNLGRIISAIIKYTERLPDGDYRKDVWREIYREYIHNRFNKLLLYTLDIKETLSRDEPKPNDSGPILKRDR